MDRSSPATPVCAEPIRTCVGCRERSPKSELLRLVVRDDTAGMVVSPDPQGTASGRGAHLHPAITCLDKAERQRAFSRAFRVAGPFDSSALRIYLQTAGADRRP